MKYKKSPVVIDAYPVSELMDLNRNNYDELPECITTAYANGELMFSANGIEIQCDGEYYHADTDDMIVFEDGMLHALTRDYFEATHEPA